MSFIANDVLDACPPSTNARLDKIFVGNGAKIQDYLPTVTISTTPNYAKILARLVEKALENCDPWDEAALQQMQNELEKFK